MGCSEAWIGLGGYTMDGTMRAAVMTGKRQMIIEERRIPQIKPDEVLVKIEYVGVCGSDLHFFKDGHIGDYVVDEPMVLGHESGGTVVEVGSDVKHLKVGDRVALEPGVMCGECELCKSGKYNLCETLDFMAVPHQIDGAFCGYLAHPAKLCFRLPDNVSTMEGGLVEPLAVGLHAVGLSGAKMGQSAVVIGLGCIGLVTIMSLKAAGVDEIYAIGHHKKNLKMAEKLGAVKTLDPRSEDALAFIKSLPGGGVDQVYETAGSEGATLMSAKMIKRAGKVTLVGMCPEGEVKFDFGSLFSMEGQVLTVWRYRNLYPQAIDLISRGKIDVKQIVTHVFDFEDIIEGINFNIDNKSEVIKAVIKM